MTYLGHIRNGVVVLDDDDAVLAEGTPVRVSPVSQNASRRKVTARSQTVGQRLMRFAGRAKGLPRDMARNHDHYIHGAPKK